MGRKIYKSETEWKNKINNAIDESGSSKRLAAELVTLKNKFKPRGNLNSEYFEHLILNCLVRKEYQKEKKYTTDKVLIRALPFLKRFNSMVGEHNYWLRMNERPVLIYTILKLVRHTDVPHRNGNRFDVPGSVTLDEFNEIVNSNPSLRKINKFLKSDINAAEIIEHAIYSMEGDALKEGLNKWVKSTKTHTLRSAIEYMIDYRLDVNQNVKKIHKELKPEISAITIKDIVQRAYKNT